MSDRPDPETLLRQAAHLRMLVSISKARSLLKRGQQLIERHAKPMTTTSPEIVPTSGLDAELFTRRALKPDGTPFGQDEADAADLAAPELVRIGAVKLRVVDPDPRELAAALGASADGEGGVAWLVEVNADGPQPCTGQVIAVKTGVEGVGLSFVVWIAAADLDSLPDLGPGAERNPALAGLGPGQALLVLELPEAME